MVAPNGLAAKADESVVDWGRKGWVGGTTLGGGLTMNECPLSRV